MFSALRSARALLVATAMFGAGVRAATAAPPAPAVERLLEDGVLSGRAYRLWKDAGSGFRNTEHAAWIVVSDALDVSLVEWPRRGLLWKETWTGPLPPNSVAIIHTHPDAVDPRPSENDERTARNFGIPNYAISRQGIWKATPGGDVIKVDGEAWIVRCASRRGCGAEDSARTMAVRLDGRPPLERDGLP